jgi:hypothetical protein
LNNSYALISNSTYAYAIEMSHMEYLLIK